MTLDSNWACIVETTGADGQPTYGLLAVKDGTGWAIRGFTSESNGLEYFQSSYNRAHRLSYEASMSACLNAIYFRPSIIQLTIAEIQPMISALNVVSWRNVSGHVDVIPLIADQAQTFWKRGKVPSLIGHTV